MRNAPMENEGRYAPGGLFTGSDVNKAGRSVWTP